MPVRPDDDYDGQINDLRKLDVHLEQALRESMNIQERYTLHTITHRLRLLRSDVQERIENLAYRRKKAREGSGS